MKKIMMILMISAFAFAAEKASEPKPVIVAKEKGKSDLIEKKSSFKSKEEAAVKGMKYNPQYYPRGTIATH